MAPGNNKTSIAIVGGGIAGLTLAIGLQKYEHFEIHIYESAKAFGEIGAGVVLGPNSQRAMKMIDPRILEGYNRRAAFTTEPDDENGLSPWMTVYKGQEPDVGKKVIQFRHKTKGSSVHRAHFLEELVKLIDTNRVKTYFSKRLSHLEESGRQSVTLHFKDNTTVTADIVVGADGVHSVVRQHILGPTLPSSKAFFSGVVQYRATIPLSLAKTALQSSISTHAHSETGKDGMVFGFAISDTLFYIGVTVWGLTWNNEQKWTAEADDVKPKFKDWSQHSRTLVELLPEDGKTMAWSIWEMPPAPTYYSKSNPVVMIGDAAHASTPFQGAGAGQAIEDCLVLERLLGAYLGERSEERSEDSEFSEDLAAIFQAYDTIRRPLSQKVVSRSRETGRIWSCNEPGVGRSAEEIRNVVEGRQKWIWDCDLEEQVRDACLLVEDLRDARRRT